jgi:glycosyltransferase involved in cell wall biosynthesis
MKILVVNFSIGGYAGDSKSMITIVRGLEKLGHKVIIVTTDGNGYFYDKKRSRLYEPIREKLSKNVQKIIEIDNMKIMPIHCISERLGMYCPSAKKMAKKIILDYDIVYIINWYYHLGMVFSKIAYELEIPFIVGPMASLEEKGKKNKKRKKDLLDILYTKSMIKHATGFHCVGEQERESLIKLGADSRKIILINNGINKIKNKIKNDDYLKKNKNFYLESEYIVTVGRIDHKKGVDILINAFSKIVKKIRIFLIIIGTGEESYVKQIKELIQKLGLTSLVKFSGYVTDDEKYMILKNAKLFVSASRSDIHPIAAIEALASGLPTIITKESDFPEIDFFNAGKTVDSDEKSISDAVVELINDKNLVKYSENAKKLVDKKFLLENQITQYEEMFLKIIKRHRIKK